MRLPVRFSLIALLVIVALTASVAYPETTVQAASRPPNIVFILTDDLDFSETAVMPNLKALIADQGATFNHYFVSVSLCCPSRTTTLRGQYSHNTQVLTNGGGNGGFETAYKDGVEQSTIATWLDQGGYQTGLFGKYLNGYPHTASTTYIPPGWVDWNSAVKGNPYSEYNYTLNQNGTLTPYQHAPEDYGTDVYTKQATQFIQDSAQADKPFFVYLAVYAPHQPATPAPQDANLFPGAQAPRTPNYNEADVSDKPGYIANSPLLKPAMMNRIDTLYRKRIESLQAVDRAIASLYDTLKAEGQLDNTYIVFTSDNGFHLGNHRMPSGKQTAYEEDIHVPMMIRGPQIPAGEQIDQLAGNIDLAPTFAAMAGVTPPSFVDGRSLLPLAQGQTPSDWRQAYLVEHWLSGPADPTAIMQEPEDDDQLDTTAEPGGATATPTANRKLVIPEFHGIRVDGYTYVEYATGEKELYDLTKDPYELNNLASSAPPELLKPFADRLAALVHCQADACRTAENQPFVVSATS